MLRRNLKCSFTLALQRIAGLISVESRRSQAPVRVDGSNSRVSSPLLNSNLFVSYADRFSAAEYKRGRRAGPHLFEGSSAEGLDIRPVIDPGTKSVKYTKKTLN